MPNMPKNTPISDEDLADILNAAPATPSPFRRKPATPTMPSVPVPDGYIAIHKGSNTYHAREALRRLGGYWDAGSKCWYIPDNRYEAALRAISDASRAQRELTADEVAGILNTFGVPHKAGTTSTAVSPTSLLCWECGGSLTNDGNRRRMGQPIPLAGANLDTYYCGCGERGDMHKRHRPKF